MLSVSQADRAFCLRAVPYLKMALADNDPSESINESIEVSAPDHPVLRSAGGRLRIAYLVDEGERFAYVQRRQLQASGLTEEALHAQAIANLMSLAEQHLEVHKTGHIYPVILDGHFEASLLLLDELWTRWYAELAPGGFVAAFPTRDVMAFGDVAAPETIPELEALLARVPADADHRLTNELYIRVGDGWQPWRRST